MGRLVVRVLVVASVALLAVVPARAADRGSSAPPQPSVCQGNIYFDLSVPPGTTPMTMTGTLTCGIHAIGVSGTAATSALVNLCPTGPAATLTVSASETDYDTGQVTSSTWTFSGAAGVFELTTSSQDVQRTGVFTTQNLDPLVCNPGSPYGLVAAVQTATGTPTPDVFRCHATGSAGPMQLTVFPGRPTVWQYSGPASGSGTCISNAGSWKVSYNATSYGYSWACPTSDPCSSPAAFGGGAGLPIMLTHGKSAITSNQLWQEESGDLSGLGWPMYVGNQLVPIGAGRVVEQPSHPVPVGGTVATTTDWVFVND